MGLHSSECPSLSSGATVAALSQRSTIGSILIQPYFYPLTPENVSWVGFLKALWVDAKGRFREETERNTILNLLSDLWIQFFSNGTTNTIHKITNETTCTSTSTGKLENVFSIFEAGCKLTELNPGDRKIYVNFNNTSVPFSETNTSLVNYLTSLWNSTVGSGSEPVNATCVIKYIRGEDSPCSSVYTQRSRTLNLSDYCPGKSGSGVWKLGDIFFSTPTVLTYRPNNSYHLRYLDFEYLNFIRTDAYKKRTSYIFAGANDGMLHVFRAGFLKTYKPQEDKPLKLLDLFDDNIESTPQYLGKEEWAFIPQNALPYLVWYGHKDYCHIPTVDYRTYVFDASIGRGPEETKTPDSWRTLLLGVMGFGGKEICIKKQGNNCIESYSSSIFVLDLTDWLKGTSSEPKVLWERALAG